jgi:hypothetical protein
MRLQNLYLPMKIKANAVSFLKRRKKKNKTTAIPADV